jgi:hypothetical protein
MRADYSGIAKSRSVVHMAFVMVNVFCSTRIQIICIARSKKQKERARLSPGSQTENEPPLLRLTCLKK